VSEGSCTLALSTAGTRTLTATYGGDASFAGSSASEPHAVGQAATTTTITGDDPDPSAVGESIVVTYSVTSGGDPDRNRDRE
jgi:hypothetical protein